MNFKKYIKFNEYSGLRSFFKKYAFFRLVLKKLRPDKVAYRNKGLTKPIFVTGIHRSGTSWIGDILSYADGLLYWREPYNPSTVSSMKNQFLYLSPDSDSSYYKNFTDDMFKGDFVGSLFDFTQKSEYLSLAHHRHLIKDPTAAFMTDWMCSRYDIDVVVVGRHPAGFVSSVVQLSWDFDFDVFLTQKTLMEKYLYPYEDIIKEYNKPGMSVAKAAVLWAVIYYVLEKMSLEKKIIWVTYEDFCESPVHEFKELFKNLNLSWNSKVERQLISSTNSDSTFSDNITTDLKRDTAKMKSIWKDRLSKNDQIMIHSLISKFDIKLYEYYKG